MFSFVALEINFEKKSMLKSESLKQFVTNTIN
jgi:hypothetical protein